MEKNKNKAKNIQRIVDFWADVVFNSGYTANLSLNSEKIGRGIFVWGHSLDIIPNPNNNKLEDFKKILSDKIEKNYPNVHIGVQGTPRGVLKDVLRDLNIDIKKGTNSSIWVEDDKIFLREGDNPPKIY